MMQQRRPGVRPPEDVTIGRVDRCWRRRAIAAACVLLCVAAGSILRLAPPGADGEDGFSTERAMEHVRVIALQPHPVGSLAADEVRAYLRERLLSLGLETRVETLTRRGRTLHNVVARLRGSGGLKGARQAVMLAAHYDSAPASLGAADDGAAVAALLEVARVLAADRPSRNILFLFTDGEEAGLLGARSFVERDPWRDEPGVVLNFEARGTSGPSVLFETSSGNAELIAHAADVALHPVTTSLAGDVYRRMPNDTDLTIFKQAGMPGLGFAFIGSYVNYHTSRDDVRHLDPRSLRHHGRQALALARRFGSLPSLQPLKGGKDAVFFDVLAMAIVHYPARWAMPLAVGAGVLLAAAAGRSMWRRRASIGGILLGALLAALSAACAVAAGYGVVRLLPARWLDDHAGFASGLIAGGAVVFAVGILVLAGRRISTPSLAAGGLLVWALAAIATAAWAPGGSYLPLVPLIFGTAALLAMGKSTGTTSVRFGLILALSIPPVLLLTPTIWLMFQALTMQRAFAAASLPALLAWSIVPALRLGRCAGAVEAPADRTDDESPASNVEASGHE